ncbi:hypothetical protein V8G54_028848 [Vigna mungo]|uniref:Uncharacterized protein n=1 Tax=Vigna mungo TaxID=3915 RepID=A0AAQ3MT07_VIGMU
MSHSQSFLLKLRTEKQVCYILLNLSDEACVITRICQRSSSSVTLSPKYQGLLFPPSHSSTVLLREMLISSHICLHSLPLLSNPKQPNFADISSQSPFSKYPFSLNRCSKPLLSCIKFEISISVHLLLLL